MKFISLFVLSLSTYKEISLKNSKLNPHIEIGVLTVIVSIIFQKKVSNITNTLQLLYFAFISVKFKTCICVANKLNNSRFLKLGI